MFDPDDAQDEINVWDRTRRMYIGIQYCRNPECREWFSKNFEVCPYCDTQVKPPVSEPKPTTRNKFDMSVHFDFPDEV